MRRPAPTARPMSTACALRGGCPCALMLLLFAIPTAAQNAAIDDGAGRVHLNDSFEAREELDQIALLAERQQWLEVVRRYQALIDTHGDMLIAREDGLFVSVATEVASRLIAMPTAAVRAYRSEFESVARAAPGAADDVRDIGVMLRCVDNYFCTQTAGRVAERAAELLCEDGRFDRAAELMRRLLGQHPDFISQPPEKVARLGVMLAWAGRLDEAESTLDNLRERAPATMVRWGGQTLAATEVLSEQIERVRRRAPASNGFAWPMLGGDLTRTRVIDSTADAGAALWRFPLEPPIVDEESQSRESDEPAMRPLLVDEVVYFQDATRAWAVDSTTGRLRWRFDSVAEERPVNEGYGDRSAPALHVPAVHRGATYVVLGEPATSYFGSAVQQSRVALVRLDERGEPVWRLGAEAFGHAFARVHLDPAPIADGDHVFVIVRRQKTSGFEDCLLARVDALTGAIDWQTHVSSAAIGGYGYRVPTLSIASKRGDMVFVGTNLGAVAAVDAWTGRIRWLRAYTRVDPGQGTGLLSRNALPEHPFDYHPLFCTDDVIVALPTDSASLLVIDPNDGSMIGDVPRSTLGDPVTLLGMFDDRLFALGRELTCWDLREGRTLWTRPRPDEPIRGRPALTRSAVYWPCTGGIVRWDLQSPEPRRTEWDDPALAGNLLATPDQLIALSVTTLSLLERKSSAIERLQDRVADSPDDPEPRLDLAEVTLRTGDLQIGAAALEHVVGRLADPASAAVIADPSLRKRIHDACMAYGTRMQEAPGATPSDPTKWFRAAGRYATAPPEQIAYRMALAAALSESDPSAAIGTYRQIIVDRSLCEQLSAPPETAAPTAGEIAAERIATLIQTHGPKVYATFEREAASALRVALERDSLAALDAVVRRYPNAKASAEALLASGAWLSRHDQPMAAVRRYDRALTQFSSRIDEPDVMLRLATCYRIADRPESALAWVSKGARLFPAARVRVDGGAETSFDQLAEQWRAELAVRAARGPTLVPPLRQADDIRLPAEGELLEPTLDRRSDGRRGAFFVYADQAVTCHVGVSGEAMWPQAAPCRVRPTLLTLDDERAVFATRHQVFALSITDGSRAWEVGKYPADVDAAHTDPEWFDVFERHVIAREMLISIKSNDEALRIDPATGEVLWSAVLPGRPRGGAAVDEHLFAFVEVVGDVGFDGNRSLLWLIDAGSGEMRARIEIDHRDAVPSNGLRFTPDGTLLLTTTRRMEVYETSTHERLWDAVSERHLQTDTLSVGVDGICVADRDGRLVKRSLADGSVLWSRDLGDPADRRAGAMAVQWSGATLVTWTSQHLAVLDAHDGRVVRESILPENADGEFTFVALTPDAVFSIVAEGEPVGGDAETTARLTATLLPRADTRTAAPDAEPINLGRISPVPERFHLVDHALISVLNGRAVRWVDATAADRGAAP